jgi:hypothetical protein
MIFNYELRIRNYGLVKIRVISVLIFFFLLFAVNVYAQESFTITNYFTEQYRDFPLTKISIIPPAGFEKDTLALGFYNKKYSSALRAGEMRTGVKTASDIFFKSFDSLSRKDSSGMTLLESYSFKINGFNATLASLYGNIEGEDYFEWRIFIGDTANTYIVKGYFPANKKSEIDHAIRSALLSVFYEPDRRILPPNSDWTMTPSGKCACQRK